MKTLTREDQPALMLGLEMLRRGFLEVRADGTIWRMAFRTHGVWKQCQPRRAENTGPKGYLRVTVQCSDGRTHCIQAHRLVWEWLVGPIPDGLQINHKNLIKKDNRIENLEVVTGVQNRRHAAANGVSFHSFKSGMRAGHPVLSRDRWAEVLDEVELGCHTVREVAAGRGVSSERIYKICKEERDRRAMMSSTYPKANAQ